MMPVNSIASVNVSVTELNSLKTRINELQARVEDQVNLTTMLNELRTRVEAQDQYIKMNQIHSQSLIQDQSSPAQSETLSLRISQSQINVSPTKGRRDYRRLHFVIVRLTRHWMTFRRHRQMNVDHERR